MKRNFSLIALAAITFLIIGGLTVNSQTPPKDSPDPEIQKMVREVSAKNIEATIRKLVTFGTRNTLSSQTIQIAGSAPQETGYMANFKRSAPIAVTV